MVLSNIFNLLLNQPLIKNDATLPETNPTTEAPTTTTVTESKTINADTDYLEFDEVLRSIAVDTKSYSRRKPLDNTLSNHSFSVDYIIFEEDNGTSNTNVDNFAYMINMMQDNEAATEPPVTETTKIVIDLLSAAEKLGAKSNTTEGMLNDPISGSGTSINNNFTN